MSRDSFDFEGRVVLVTGAARGIGRAIARGFASSGASVVVHYLQSEASAARLAAEVGGIAIGADLRIPEQVERLVSEAVSMAGAIEVLVNNAGAYPLHDLVTAPPEAWKAVLETNLLAVHLCTQAVARVMIERRIQGAVVNVASIEGLRPAPLHSHYHAAKSGVLAYTRSAALELGPHGIRVNSVSPGLIWREGIEEAWPEGVRSYRARAPLGRLGRPEEVGDACLFLASARASFVTGANLVVDGGVLAAPAF